MLSHDLTMHLTGVTEAFVHAVLDKRQLAVSNVLMVFLSVAHIGACALLITRMGSAGLVAADAANMVLRILVSAWWVGGGAAWFLLCTGFLL